MGIGALLKKLGRRANEKLDAAEKGISDVKKDGEAAIKEAEAQVDRYVEKLIDLKAKINLQKNALTNKNAELLKRQTLATNSTYTPEQLATNASKIQNVTGEIASLTATIASMEATYTQLDGTKKKAQAKIDSYRTKLSTMAARSDAADLKIQMSGLVTSLNEGLGGLSELDEIEQSVAEKEARADACDEMSENDDPFNL